MLIKILLHCFVLYFALGTAYSEICNLPDGGMGKCVAFDKCTKLVNLVRRNMRNPQVRSYIKSLQCSPTDGYYVCCSDCYTPEGKTGACMPIQECPNLVNLVNSNVNYVRNSMCMSGGTDVCCGPLPAQPTRGRCESQLTAFPPDPATGCCGVEATLTRRLLGGTLVNIDQSPWLVLLEYKKHNQIALLCGGALISNKYVVTAAHCVKDSSRPVNVRVGEFDIGNPGQDCVSAPVGERDCTLPAISVPIKRIVKHPEYDTTLYRNDIALIELETAVNYTDFVRPICLPSDDISDTNSNADLLVAGWGSTSWREPSNARIKKHLTIPLVDMQVCRDNYYHRAEFFKSRQAPMLWSRQLCAGGEEGKDSCNGDSGGPLMSESWHNGVYMFTLDGVFSFGPNECRTRGLPSIYTRGLPGIYSKVIEYNTWIRRTIEP